MSNVLALHKQVQDISLLLTKHTKGNASVSLENDLSGIRIKTKEITNGYIVPLGRLFKELMALTNVRTTSELLDAPYDLRTALVLANKLDREF